MLIALAAALAFSLWYFSLGDKFELREYNIISMPTLTLRLLSALVFASFGRILYKLRFYYILFIIIVILLRNRSLYRDLKKLIWDLLMLFTGFIALPWTIDVLNSILSAVCNAAVFLLYISPALAIFIFTVAISYILFTRKKGTLLESQTIQDY